MNETDHPSTPQWMPLSTASEQVGRSVKTLRRWIKDGKIPARMESGRWLVNVADVHPVPSPPSDRPSAELQPLLSTISEMAGRMQELAERAARAEQINEHLEERLAELRDRYEKPAQDPRREKPPRWWHREKS